MTNATLETLLRLVDGLRAADIQSAIVSAVGSPEKEMSDFLRDLNATVREEIFALLCLGQDARKNKHYLLNTDARPEDVWRPSPFDSYREEGHKYTFDYFVSKPLHEYLPLAVEVIKLYEMDTTPAKHRADDPAHIGKQISLFRPKPLE